MEGAVFSHLFPVSLIRGLPINSLFGFVWGLSSVDLECPERSLGFLLPDELVELASLFSLVGHPLTVSYTLTHITSERRLRLRIPIYRGVWLSFATWCLVALTLRVIDRTLRIS